MHPIIIIAALIGAGVLVALLGMGIKTAYEYAKKVQEYAEQKEDEPKDK